LFGSVAERAGGRDRGQRLRVRRLLPERRLGRRVRRLGGLLLAAEQVDRLGRVPAPAQLDVERAREQEGEGDGRGGGEAQEQAASGHLLGIPLGGVARPA